MVFLYYCASALLALGILYGIHLMSSPKTAVRGNTIGAACMAAGIVITLLRDGTLGLAELWIAMLVGAVIGWALAKKVKMIQMPQMVALLNGFGGAASAFVAMLVLMFATTGAAPDAFNRLMAALAMVVGMVTLLGSLVAAGKLHQVLAQRPVVLPRHALLNGATIALMAVLTLCICADDSPVQFAAPLLLFVASSAFGVLFTIRVGGADMPITISLLNSCSGVAGSVAGMAVSDPLLVAVGGIVGASGLLLTQIMCRAMNRSLLDILLGKTSMPAGKRGANDTATQGPSTPTNAETPAPARTAAVAGGAPVASALINAAKAGMAACEGIRAEAVDADKATLVTPGATTGDGSAAPSPANPQDALPTRLCGAKKVLFVPGYGMALAQAQHKVKALADALEAKGADVAYAIHPVAGRMPGHMNVLLAEAAVDYDKLLEMDEANRLFPETDLVIVVGANDVINPAANKAEGTPIYGMPILDVDRAKSIIICNFDKKPGYAGVANPLYESKDVIMLIGDANASMDTLSALLRKGPDPDATAKTIDAPGAGATADGAGKKEGGAGALLTAAKSVLIVPGYGMALAQAQHKVKALADALEAKGANVAYAIHPVAGRMPGHMNVLLAEADVDYDALLEMDEANPRFANTDLALVVGANDVINPAANKAEGTPIYGMPILNVEQAKNIIICNFDKKPGYAGVDNPLYESKDVIMLTGDANASVDTLLAALS